MKTVIIASMSLALLGGCAMFENGQQPQQVGSADAGRATSWAQAASQPSIPRPGQETARQTDRDPAAYAAARSARSDGWRDSASGDGASRDDLTNQEVRDAQVALRDMGLYEGEVDGLYGPLTINAVGEFQTREDLPRTRALDERTQERLQVAARQQGDTGQQGGTPTLRQQGQEQTGQPAGDARSSAMRTGSQPQGTGQSDGTTPTGQQQRQ